MPNGETHTGASHNKNSQKLFHFDELSKEAKKKAKMDKGPKKKKAKEKSFEEAVESEIKKSRDSGY